VLDVVVVRAEGTMTSARKGRSDAVLPAAKFEGAFSDAASSSTAITPQDDSDDVADNNNERE